MASRLRKIAAVCVAVVSLGALGAIPGSAHSFTANSTITINYQGGDFYGSISSQRASCEIGRKVALHKVGKGVVGRTTSNKFGNWKIHRPRARGRYFAGTRSRTRSSYGHFHRCKGDRSPTVVVRRH